MPETSDKRLLRRVLLIRGELDDTPFEIEFLDAKGCRLRPWYEENPSCGYDSDSELPSLAECFEDLIAADSIYLSPINISGSWRGELESHARLMPARFKAPSWNFVAKGHLAELHPCKWHKQHSIAQTAG